MIEPEYLGIMTIQQAIPDLTVSEYLAMPDSEKSVFGRKPATIPFFDNGGYQTSSMRWDILSDSAPPGETLMSQMERMGKDDIACALMHACRRGDRQAVMIMKKFIREYNEAAKKTAAKKDVKKAATKEVVKKTAMEKRAAAKEVAKKTAMAMKAAVKAMVKKPSANEVTKKVAGKGKEGLSKGGGKTVAAEGKEGLSKGSGKEGRSESDGK